MFKTIHKNGLTYLTSDVLSGVSHGFSTRLGGVSQAPRDSLNLDARGDEAANVQENLGSDVSRLVLSRQVHRDDVRLVTADDCGKGLWRERDYDSADALICATPNIPLVVFSADCGVILLHDPVRGAIGAVHAGWRGTAMGIAGKAVGEMVRRFGCEAKNIHAAIGPSIGACCFETDEDVPLAVREALGTDAEPFMVKCGAKWHVDLKAINRYWLERRGVTVIDMSDHCTACRTDLYWSHRKMGLARGEQAAMISL